MSKTLSGQALSYSLTDSRHYLILFILWPFLAFIAAVTNFSQREAKKVVYFYLIYFGLTYFISSSYYVDAAGYAMDLKVNAALPFSEFFKIVGGIYSSDTSVDFIEPFISFIVSRFTQDYRMLFGVYAAIFGFFYLKSISLLHNRYQENSGWNTAIHLAFFTLILPITAINGFRMWTAAWIFFYGAYHVILYRDPRYLLLTFASVFVHWSFLSANAILVIYFLAGNRNYIYLPLAFASFVVPGLIAPFFRSISLRLGGAMQNRYESYSSTEYIIQRQQSAEQASWFLRLGNNLVFYYLLLAIIVIELRYRDSIKGKAEQNLFSFLLLFLAFVNFGKDIPSFGGRFQIIFFLFATLYVFMYFLKQPGKNINLLTFAGLFPMVLYTTVIIRQGSEGINAWILTPGFGLPWLVPGLSIADLLLN
jgi:hypothetical protein